MEVYILSQRSAAFKINNLNLLKKFILGRIFKEKIDRSWDRLVKEVYTKKK